MKRIAGSIFSIITAFALFPGALWAQSSGVTHNFGGRAGRLVSGRGPATELRDSSRFSSGKEALDSLLNSTETAATTLAFDRISADMGTMTEDEGPRTVHFHFCNTGSVPVTITKVNTTCGCTEAFAEPTMVEPGSEGAVVLTFSPRNRPGSVDVRAFVYTLEVQDYADGLAAHAPAEGRAAMEGQTATEGQAANLVQKPAARLSLTGEVVETSPWSHFPYRIGSLRLMRREVTFTVQTPKCETDAAERMDGANTTEISTEKTSREVGTEVGTRDRMISTGSGRRAVERILCANAGDTPLSLSADGLPPYATFRTDPEVIPPYSEADLVIIIDCLETIPAGFTFRVLGTDASFGPEELIDVKIKIK